MQDEAGANLRISPPSLSVRTRKRNKSIKDSAKLVSYYSVRIRNQVGRSCYFKPNIIDDASYFLFI